MFFKDNKLLHALEGAYTLLEQDMTKVNDSNQVSKL